MMREKNNKSNEKQNRLIVYILCGVIVICIGTIGILSFRLRRTFREEWEVTPTSTVTPMSTLTLTPTPEPTLTPTPEPTLTPTPTVTPTLTQTPTATPTPTPSPTVTPTPTVIPTKAPDFTVSTLDKEMQARSFVNVRDLPSTKGNKIGSLEAGDIVTVTGRCEETGWYQIEYLGAVAYVSNAYIKEIGSTMMSSFDPELDIPDLASYPEVTYSREWTDYEKECLAKIVMAEAEGESLYVKTLIAFTVINRVQSKGQGFPNTIEEVILQHRVLDNGTVIYQYEHTKTPDGRYHQVTANEDCWKAVEIVQTVKYDFSNGAMYFESNSNVEDSWIVRNLEFVVEVDGTRFYK